MIDQGLVLVYDVASLNNRYRKDVRARAADRVSARWSRRESKGRFLAMPLDAGHVCAKGS